MDSIPITGIITNKVWRRIFPKLRVWLEKSLEERQHELNKRLLQIFIDEILSHKSRNFNSITQLRNYYESTTATAAIFMPPKRDGGIYIYNILIHIFNIETFTEEQIKEYLSDELIPLRITPLWTALLVDLKKPR